MYSSLVNIICIQAAVTSFSIVKVKNAIILSALGF